MRAAVLYGEFSLYRQVETILRDQILDGALRKGDRLPSEETLRTQFGVSRGTLRQALEALESDGLISRIRGRGTFVGSGAVQPGERARMSVDEMVWSASTAQRLIRTGMAVPPASVSVALNLDRKTETPFFIRLSDQRGGKRIGLKRYLLPRFEPMLDELAAAQDFDDALALQGDVRRGEVWVEAILAEPRFAMQLSVPLGAALLSVWWVDYLDGLAAVCTQMLRAGTFTALTAREF